MIRAVSVRETVSRANLAVATIPVHSIGVQDCSQTSDEKDNHLSVPCEKRNVVLAVSQDFLEQARVPLHDGTFRLGGQRETDHVVTVLFGIHVTNSQKTVNGGDTASIQLGHYY